MFGYVSPDLPNLYIKDGMLYKALYCGLCKSIGGTCGQLARMGLSYDVTFLSALLHNLKNVDIEVVQGHCIEHWFTKRPIAKRDALSDMLACINTAWTYFKLSDDIADEKKGYFKRLWFMAGYRKVKKTHPEFITVISKRLAETSELERKDCDSPDRMADGTATMIAELSDFMLEEYATPATRQLFYLIGKWIYLIDAVDDYDKDRKKKCFNVFEKAYHAINKEALLKEHRSDLDFIFRTLFYDVRDALSRVKLHFNHDLTDNILMLGLPVVTKRILSCEGCLNCKKELKKI